MSNQNSNKTYIIHILNLNIHLLMSNSITLNTISIQKYINKSLKLKSQIYHIDFDQTSNKITVNLDLAQVLSKVS